jgi:hypothetical protein
VSVEKIKESRDAVLDALTVEMKKSPIAASAQEAMRPADGHRRKLLLIREQLFQGFACSWCGCRFPTSDAPMSLFETLSVASEQRVKQFAEHVCSEYPHSAQAAISKDHAKG